MIKNFPHIHFLQFMVLLIPSVFYSYISDEVSFGIVALVGGLFSLLKKKKYEATQSIYIRFLLIAVLLATFQALIFEVESRFYLTSAEECYPYVLYLGLMFSFFKEHPKYNMSIIIISAFCMMFCGDVVFDLDFPQLGLSKSYGEVPFVRSVYILFLLFYFPFFVTLLRKSLPKKELIVQDYTHYKQRFLAISIAILLVILLVVPMRKTVLPIVKKGDRYLADKILSFYNEGHRFSKKTDLRRNFDDYDANDDEVLVSVYSDTTPGYLRAQVFTQYIGGMWEESRMDGEMLNVAQGKNIYQLESHPSDELLNHIKVYYHDNMDKKYLLHRGNSSQIKVETKYLFRSQDGILKGSQFQGELELFEYEIPILAGQLSQGSFEEYLELSPYLRAQMEKHHDRIFGADKNDLNSQELMGKVVQYFKNYTYEFGVNLDKGIDPAIAFLDSDVRRGHCEYFANASTLLLRSVGVPARYVTGFFCVEKHPYENKYIGRGHDLHAWVEAYDSQTKRWVVVESTPSAGIPNSTSDSTVLSSFFDAIKEAVNSVFKAFKEGTVKEILLSLLKLVGVFLIFLIKSVYGWALISGLIIWRIRKYLRIEKACPRSLLEKKIEEQRGVIDTVLEKQLHIKDLESYTVRDLMAIKEIAENQSLCKHLSDYERLLYSKCSKDLEQVTELGQIILKSLKSLKASV